MLWNHEYHTLRGTVHWRGSCSDRWLICFTISSALYGTFYTGHPTVGRERHQTIIIWKVDEYPSINHHFSFDRSRKCGWNHGDADLYPSLCGHQDIGIEYPKNLSIKKI